jgi:dethiobiotin synthetase
MAKAGIFVSGTDTGVGKTVVSAGLLGLARSKGLKAWGIKPIETGCEERSGTLFPEDGALLRSASGNAISLELCAPFRFPLPASPYRAAASAGSTIGISELVNHIHKVADGADFILAEGAGGLMVPINASEMMIDFARKLGYPVLLVARTRLGTVNHTLLSVEALSNRNIPLAGIILSQSGAETGPEEKHTPADIQEFLPEVPILTLPALNPDVVTNAEHIAAVMAANWPESIIDKWLAI